jgi:hypothetical protein
MHIKKKESYCINKIESIMKNYEILFGLYSFISSYIAFLRIFFIFIFYMIHIYL